MLEVERKRRRRPWVLLVVLLLLFGGAIVWRYRPLNSAERALIGDWVAADESVGYEFENSRRFAIWWRDPRSGKKRSIGEGAWTADANSLSLRLDVSWGDLKDTPFAERLRWYFNAKFRGEPAKILLDPPNCFWLNNVEFVRVADGEKGPRCENIAEANFLDCFVGKTSIETVRAKWPMATKVDPQFPSAPGLLHLRIRSESSTQHIAQSDFAQVDEISWRFIDGRLYRMWAVVSAKDSEDFEKLLRECLGPPQQSKGLRWIDSGTQYEISRQEYVTMLAVSEVSLAEDAAKRLSRVDMEQEQVQLSPAP